MSENKNSIIKIHSVLLKAKNSDELRAKLKNDPKRVLEQEGIQLKGNQIKVFENTKKDRYIIIPFKLLDPHDQVNQLTKTPSLSQIGRYIITQVQLKTPIGQQILSDPWKALHDHGVNLPKLYKIHIINAEKDCSYLVIPRKNQDDEELDDIEMKAFVGGKGATGSKANSTAGEATQIGLMIGMALL